MSVTDNLTSFRRNIPAHEIEDAKRYLLSQCGEWQYDISRHDLTLVVTSSQKCIGILGALGKIGVTPNQFSKGKETILQITEEHQIDNMRRIGIGFKEGGWSAGLEGLTSSPPVHRGR